MSRPDILFILIDTLRADRLGFYGGRRPLSPNLDRLCSWSVVFENAIVSAPWTLPSHASLFTGLFPSEHGASDENPCLRNDIPTLAELLAQTGYQTVAYATDNGWLSDDTHLMRGFEVFYGPKYRHPPGKIRNRLLNKIVWKLDKLFKLDTSHHLMPVFDIVENYLGQQRQYRKPLFFFLNLMDTHMPYRPSQKALVRFGLDKADPDQIAYLQDQFRQYRTQPEKLSKQQMQLLSDLYDACIWTVDSRLKRLFKSISRRPNRENTILIISADHGEQFGEHGLLNHWMNLYDSLLRVPLIIWSPARLTKPCKITPQVQQHDLFYTILDLAGYSGTQIDTRIIQSKNLLEMATGRTPFPEFTFAQQSYAKITLEHIRKFNPSFNDQKLILPKQAIRTSRFKYIRYACGLEELFDIKNDPSETENILTARPDIADMLRQKLDQFSAGITEKPQDDQTARFDPEIKKRLEDLGYL